MPTPDAIHTLSDVITFVQRQFGDESGVQVTVTDITRWVNQAQMEIVNKNPMIQATATQNTVGGQQVYSIPPDMIQIESIMYDGNILEPSNFETIRAQLGVDNNMPGIPLYWYLWANQIYLWPIPTDVKVVSVNYSKTPVSVTTPADTLGLPDRYYDRICEYCMAKAYELDEDWQGHQINAQKFEDKLLEDTNADKNMVGSWWVATDSEYE
jgi:hypothetical protein